MNEAMFVPLQPTLERLRKSSKRALLSGGCCSAYRVTAKETYYWDATIEEMFQAPGQLLQAMEKVGDIPSGTVEGILQCT